jgi:hypothetical protein
MFILWRAFNQFLLTLLSSSCNYMYHSDALEASLYLGTLGFNIVSTITNCMSIVSCPAAPQYYRTGSLHQPVHPVTQSSRTTWTWILPFVYPSINAFTERHDGRTHLPGFQAKIPWPTSTQNTASHVSTHTNQSPYIPNASSNNLIKLMAAVKPSWTHLAGFVHRNTIICWTGARLNKNYNISSHYSKLHPPPQKKRNAWNGNNDDAFRQTTR